MDFGTSKAYQNIVGKLKAGLYTRNRNTLKKNRTNLLIARNRLTRKLAAGETKQEKGTKAKLDTITKLLSAMPIEEPVEKPKEVKPIKAKTAKKAKVAAVTAVTNTASVPPVVKDLQTDFFKTLDRLTKPELEAAIKYLSDIYYNDGVSLIGDENYDRMAERLKTRYGSELGVGAVVTKNKVKLPYFMGSMDKIKPDKNNLTSWALRYPGKVCISDKLDGISALYVKKDGKRVLYTRGDGTIGQDITHMIPYIQIGDIPVMDTCAVRGELIVSKASYDAVKEGKRGARQMVSGLANQKTLTKERIELMNRIEFVAYEVIVPEGLKPTEQFTVLDTRSTFHVARWTVADSVTIESLGVELMKRKDTSKYEIDGIIVAHDAVYPRTVGNPDHAFAFKMSFADQQAVTEVLQVNWDVSKDGYLKPTVNFEPVNIGGVIIQYATGFNAKFIHDNGIGPGAFVDIIRSGDVIPYIQAVKSAAPAGPQMPTAKWHWNETHVDAVLDEIGANPDVQKRILLYFANTLEIGFCGEGNINKIYAAGIRTVPRFVHMTADDLVKSGEFTAKGAAKLISERDAAFKKATIVEWAVGSGLFGRGIGTKRLVPAFEATPRDLVGGPDLVGAISAISGWSRESAEGFVENLPAFKRFMESVGIKPKVASPKAVVTEGKLVGHVILFTGWHPKDLEALVVAEGGVVADTWGSKVTILVVKDETVSNEKTKKAAAAGVPVMTGVAFKAKYGA